jgi:hypothetical protein
MVIGQPKWLNGWSESIRADYFLTIQTTGDTTEAPATRGQEETS